MKNGSPSPPRAPPLLSQNFCLGHCRSDVARQGVAHLFRPPASDRMAARRAVPVATQKATGIDSNARPNGGPQGPCPLRRRKLRASTAELPAAALGFLVFLLAVRWIAASARHPGRVACAALRQGAGAWQPLAPYNPLPRLGPVIRGGDRVPSGVPCPPLRRAPYGLRPSAVPHAGRASGRRRSFRARGAAISSAP